MKTTKQTKKDRPDAKVITLRFESPDDRALFGKLERAGDIETRTPTTQVRHVLRQWAEGSK